MKMLAKFWRLWFRNTSEGGSRLMDYDLGARIAIRSMPWKISSGDLVYGNVITEDMGFGATDIIAIGGIVSGTVVDNSSGLYQGVNGTFETTHNNIDAIGSCSLFVELSDNNGNWPGDSDDFDIDDLKKVSLLLIDNSAEDKSRSVNFSFPL